MLRGAEGEHALLGAGFLLVAARPAEGRVELVFVERLLQRLRLHDLGVKLRTVRERPDAHLDPLGIDVFDELQAPFLDDVVAELDHLAELPGRVDVEQREGRLRRIEGFHRDMQHRHGVLADRKQHHRLFAFRDSLAHDVDALRLEPIEMAERTGRKRAHPNTSGAPGLPGPRRRTPSSPTCRPHSFLSSCSHHQRPARSSSPGFTARVQGAQPMEK